MSSTYYKAQTRHEIKILGPTLLFFTYKNPAWAGFHLIVFTKFNFAIGTKPQSFFAATPE